MFCKTCGSLVTLGKCPQCGEGVETVKVDVEAHHEGLTDLELREQNHIQRQRKKQEVWKIPDGEE